MGRTRTVKANPGPVDSRPPHKRPPSGKAATPLWDYRAAVISSLLVLFAIVAAFSPCLTNDFVAWDDDENFLKNPYYRGLGWSQLRWAWTSFRDRRLPAAGLDAPGGAVRPVRASTPGDTTSAACSCMRSIPSSCSR